MDFAFVPGGTPYELLLQRAMQNRDPKTTLINKPGVKNVVDFLAELVAQNLKGGDLILGAHASSEDFVMPFDSTKPPRADYEKVEALSAAGTVHIPSSVKGANTSLHLKGCHIGETAVPLLKIIKTAFDNPVQVTAPRFLHALHDDAGLGILEFMRYAFEVTTPDAKNFDKRADLVAAFQSPPKPFLQGVEKGQAQTPVPKDDFEKWIPKQAQLDSMIDRIPLPISVKLNPPVLRRNPITGSNKLTSLSDIGGFNAFPDDITWPMDMTGRTVPPDKAGKIALLKQQLQTDQRWKDPPAHPFPYYVRYGYDTFNAFFDAFDWDVALDVSGSNQTLHFRGLRFIYRLEFPVVKKGTNELIYNYYPQSGIPVMNFREDNAKFEMFGIV